MKRNVGNIDRGFRGVVGLAAIVIFLSGAATTPLMYWGSLVVGVVMLSTAVFRWCPPYSIFGINTCEADSKE